ncbi:MAG TPA: hypothetical protein QF753_18595 [Victivallales bacterium]|nr:hypothetical protein [Victivallales bacterium]
MTKIFIPTNFTVPEKLVTDNYRLEVLTPNVTELDYDAVMSSMERLRNIFGENTKWPEVNMTREENTRDLVRHEQEFRLREAFAYTVLTLSREKCIGCVYINPSTFSKFDCEIYLWVRDSHIALDNRLYKDVKNWLINFWPFKRMAFPGREVSWGKWVK